MKILFRFLITLMLLTLSVNSLATTRPGFVIAPFTRSVNLASNSTANVLIVAQNATGTKQTITNVAPQIPTNSGISATVAINNCGFLLPGASCAALIKLQSGSNPKTGNLNVSVCSFNGTFCSRIINPIDFSSTQPIAILVSPTNPVIANGTTKQFYAIGLFSNLTIQNITDTVTWGSSNTSKATISNANESHGLATGIAAGISTISAKLNGGSGATTLTITPATLTSITITPTNPGIANGTTQQFNATGIYSDNSNQDLTSQVIWSSSNQGVATISNASGQHGLASSKSVGATTITATLGAISGSTSLTVSAATLVSLSVTPTHPSTAIYTTKQFTATGIYTDNTNKDLTAAVTWSTQSAQVAIISNQSSSIGQAVGVGTGSTNVIATLGNLSGSTVLQVTPAVLTAIDVQPTNTHLVTGNQEAYHAIGTYNNNRTQDITSSVTWISSNTNIATISNAPGSQGLAKAIQGGSTAISATLNGITGRTNLTVDAVTLQSITITPTTPSIANGTSSQLTATGYYSDASTQDLTTQVTWISSTPSVAEISNASGTKGLATSVATGSTTITAIFSGVSGNTTLTVTPAVLTTITITPVNSSIANGTTQTFTATGIFSNDSHQDLTSLVTWNSTNTAVAEVSNAINEKGQATAQSTGSTTITATLGAVSGTTILNVTAAVLTTLSVIPTNPSSAILTAQQFTATGIYSDNTNKDLTKSVTWNTQDRSVAIIANLSIIKGIALAIGTGSTSVTATLDGQTGATTWQVTPAVLTGIDIQPTNTSLPAGNEQTYTATGTYNTGRTQDITTLVTWLSSNSAIATISNATGLNGVAKGITTGTVSISASLDGVVNSTNLTVSSPTLQSITVTPVTPTIANGTTQQFLATGHYSDASTQDLTKQATWSSSSPTNAVISNAAGSTGLATSVSAGSTTITATFDGVSGNTVLTVSAATLTTITITPSASTIPNGTSEQLTATGTYSDLSTKNITDQVTWKASNANVTVSNATGSKGLVTGVTVGSTTISALFGSVSGNTSVTVINADIGDNLQGGKVACLEGGLNNLITANTNNSNNLMWGGNGTTTNAQSTVNGGANTTKVVNVLGAGLTYAAGLCDAYEIDSAGNTPCVGGNTCYNDWFLPSVDQLSCMRSNRNKINDFDKDNYWSSTESSASSNNNAWYITFANSGQPPATASKTETYPVRCTRIINNTVS